MIFSPPSLSLSHSSYHLPISFPLLPLSLSSLLPSLPPLRQALLRSDLPTALETALRGDERTALDVMRLVELLLVLIMEGRKALPKTTQVGMARKMESFSGDRNHRQVIEAIRASNNDDFFEAMESGEWEGEDGEREKRVLREGVSVCVCVCVCVCVRVHVCMCACMCVCACVHACMCACVCVGCV